MTALAKATMPVSSPGPVRSEAERFLAALTGDPDTRVTFQSFDDSDAKRRDFARVLHGTLEQQWRELVRLNSAGAGIFVMVNEGDGKGRRSENVQALRALFVDDDTGELEPAALEFTPSIIVRSKNGLHAYWRLKAGERLNEFAPAQAALAATLRTDETVKDLPRVMRLPGTLHMKDPGSPFLVRLVQTRDVTYTIVEVLEGYGMTLAAPELPRHALAPQRTLTASISDRERRARAYAAKVPGAVQGEHGDVATLFVACRVARGFDLDEGTAVRVLADEFNPRCSPPWSEEALAEKVRNAMRYGDEPVGGMFSEETRRPFVMGGAPMSAEVAAVPETISVRLTIEDADSPPVERFILGPMLPLEKPSVIFGPTSVGKSAAIAQIAFHLAAGSQSLWGLPLLPGSAPVLIYTAEDTLDDWKRKAGAIYKAGGIDIARALSRLYIIDKSEGTARLSEVVTERTEDPIKGQAVSRRVVRPTEEQDRLIAEARRVGARLIVVETASRLVDDEDNPSFAGLTAALGRVARETGAAVLLSHHATKAASKENDSAIENARGGGALIANARNALSLFPADEHQAKPFSDRFPVEDIAVLVHGKSTSSTRRHPPIILVRCDATHGPVFRLPEEVNLSPEMERVNAERLELERRRETEALSRLYIVVEQALPTRPALSPSWLRENAAKDLGVSKHRVEPLVRRALALGVLKENKRSERGITLTLGRDPRKPPEDSVASWASPGESPEGEA